MMCGAAKEPNSFLKIASIAGGPAQLETIAFATCNNKYIITKIKNIDGISGMLHCISEALCSTRGSLRSPHVYIYIFITIKILNIDIFFSTSCWILPCSICFF